MENTVTLPFKYWSLSSVELAEKYKKKKKKLDKIAKCSKKLLYLPNYLLHFSQQKTFKLTNKKKVKDKNCKNAKNAENAKPNDIEFVLNLEEFMYDSEFHINFV